MTAKMQTSIDRLVQATTPASVRRFPGPVVPTAWSAGANETVKLLQQDSSAQQFASVHDKAMAAKAAKAAGKAAAGGEEPAKERGAALRELEAFFAKHDADRSFGGMRRVVDARGNALWTAIATEEEIEAKLREREAARRS
jgi:hypothetical protein